MYQDKLVTVVKYVTTTYMSVASQNKELNWPKPEPKHHKAQC